jgi:FtsZ-binding cell division protein ZapB
MGISSDIISQLNGKKQQAYDGIEFLQKNIILKDGLKETYDAAIVSIDADLFAELEIVNDKFRDVKDAYQARVNAGCRTDMFWRVLGISTTSDGGGGTNEYYNIQVTKLSLVGYSTAGIGSTSGVGLGTDGSVAFLNPSGGITTYPPRSIFGFEQKNLYGLKYYDEPSQREVGDTFVTSFIGTVSIGSSVLTVMSPIGSGVTIGVAPGQLVTSSKNGIFALDYGEVVGIGTALADLSVLSGVGNTVGVGTTTELVSTIILDSVVSIGASAPEQDGSFVTFTVLQSPAGIGTTAISYFRLPFTANPFSPQTLGIEGSGQYGVGKSVYFDNSGFNSNVQTWRPEFAREEISEEFPAIQEPEVGAGKIYYTVGFSSYPADPIGGGRAVEGTTFAIDTSLIGVINLYDASPTCPTEETNLTNAINIANTAESAIQSGLGDLNYKINAVNAIRDLRTDIQLEIWGNRQAIGGLADDIDKYDSAIEYLGVTTITSLLP